MIATPLETVVLRSAVGLCFVDAWSGQPVLDGLRCTLWRKRDGQPLAREAVTPGGVHHWPALRAPWNAADLPPALSPPEASPPAPLAEVLVEDLFARFLSLRFDWPPLADNIGGALATITLASAPQRSAPPGSASLAGLLIDAGGLPAAWARLLATDAAGRSTEGMSDAAGRFALHVAFPRPERKPLAGAPSSPPPGPPLANPPDAPANPAAPVTLRVFHDSAVASEAARVAAAVNAISRARRALGRTGADATGATQLDGVALPAAGAPHAALWRAQHEVRALARIATADVLGPLRLEPGRPAVPRTEGLPPNRSELRLAPL